jgi:CDP-diacylglycerol---glycerol-3-phosphate 3-phosphatidyltransferase
MTPNQVTAVRVMAAFAAVAVFTFSNASFAADLIALALTLAAIALDALDGFLARRRNLATAFGAQLDILGDRLVENLFFTFFAVAGLVSLWVPVVFFVRGTLTDFLRSFATRSGRVGFGPSGTLETCWGRVLVASRASRAAYASLKCVCFCLLGLLISFSHTPKQWVGDSGRATVAIASQILVSMTVAVCLVRALPVLWEGRRYFRARARQTSSLVVAGPAR